MSDRRSERSLPRVAAGVVGEAELEGPPGALGVDPGAADEVVAVEQRSDDSLPCAIAANLRRRSPDAPESRLLVAHMRSNLVRGNDP
jgi:hypothetical protein